MVEGSCHKPDGFRANAVLASHPRYAKAAKGITDPRSYDGMVVGLLAILIRGHFPVIKPRQLVVDTVLAARRSDDVVICR
jgi:hypothetical protein